MLKSKIEEMPSTTLCHRPCACESVASDGTRSKSSHEMRSVEMKSARLLDARLLAAVRVTRISLNAPLLSWPLSTFSTWKQICAQPLVFRALVDPVRTSGYGHSYISLGEGMPSASGPPVIAVNR